MVVIEKIKENIEKTMEDIFANFGGVERFLRESGDVFIKPNVIDFKPYCYTDIKILEGVIKLFNKYARKIYVIENCSQGNFTRLVFKITGIDKLCKKYNALPIFLDEEKGVKIKLKDLEETIEFPETIYKKLIEERDRNTYINLPKLKTHSMTKITLGLKNQLGLIHQSSRINNHNYNLHQKIATIYEMIKPDFTLIDGTHAVFYGHYPPVAIQEKCLEKLNILVGGDDALEVDICGAKILGYEKDEVEHLKILNSHGIEIKGWLSDKFKKKYPYDLYPSFPQNVKIVRGKDRCCVEGCWKNTEAALQILYLDFEGSGNFTILMGSGFDYAELEKIEGKVLLAGKCAVDELSDYLKKKRIKFYQSYGCNNLARTIESLCKLMGVNPLRMVSINPFYSIFLLTYAKLKGSKARLPSFI